MTQPLQPDAGRAGSWYWRHGAIIAIVVGGLVVRALFSGQSYWYDEYLSVVVYAAQHPSLFEAIARLASASVHPPLYQSALYLWIAAFGEGEIATRTLSSLYVAGATVALYATAVSLFGRRTAILAALTFSLMYAPFYYGLETRSYGQTLLLVSLGTLGTVRALLAATRSDDGWRILRDGWVWLAIVAHAGAMLTHYYNVFFVAAQAALFGLMLLARNGLTLRTIGRTLWFGLTPLALFLAVWGAPLVSTYTDNADRYVIDAPSAFPWDMLFSHGLMGNFKTFAIIAAVLVIIGTAIAISRLRRVRGAVLVPDDLGWLYAATMTWLPFVLTYLAFLIAGHERYSPRYFVYAAPALALLTVIVVDWLVGRVRRLGGDGRFVACLVALLVLVAPAAYLAATDRKEDNRGIAEKVDQMVTAAPERQFLVYEVSFRPLLEYYLERIGSPVEVAGAVLRDAERENSFGVDADAESALAETIIIAFTHDRVQNFPRFREYMQDTFGEPLTLLDRTGRGLLIYDVDR